MTGTTALSTNFRQSGPDLSTKARRLLTRCGNNVDGNVLGGSSAAQAAPRSAREERYVGAAGPCQGKARASTGASGSRVGESALAVRPPRSEAELRDAIVPR
jgi:hypothetical protein